MLTAEALSDRILKLHITGTLQARDFAVAESQFNQMIAQAGKINVLVDALAFEGWEDMDAAKAHFHFLREHQKKVGRVAVVARHSWQHWLAMLAGVFVDPDIHTYDENEYDQAEIWVQGD